MLRTDMLAELQAVVNDSTSAGLWGDAQLMSYLAEAQDRFCEDTGYFTDFVSFNVVTTIGSADYTIDSRIIEILGLYETATNRWLGNTNEAHRFPLGYDPKYPVQFSDSTADTSYWQVDREDGILTLYPTPISVRTFKIRCHRRALTALNNQTDGAYDTEPEIPASSHRALIEWAAYKAFMHHDMETQDPVKAGDHLAAYRQYIREAKLKHRRISGQAYTVGFDQSYQV